MPRNLILCCDGTSNEFARDRTNVAKLCEALVKDEETQLVFYHPGIGTMAPPGFGTSIGGRLAKLLGLAFGYGLKHDIAHGYNFIMNNYRAGDRIFLFGFSRGAYTARIIASLIHMYGLVMPGNEALTPYTVRMLWRIDKTRPQAKRDALFGLADQFKRSLADEDCKIHFLGVWDTVSSVGWVGSPVALPFSKANPSVRHARHAVAIDERRAFFRTNLLSAPEGQDLRQVWFPGVHCDVGGGYAEARSGLSKIPLEWMVGEARGLGLLVDQERLDILLGARAAPPDHAGKIPDYAQPPGKPEPNNSMTWPWWIVEFAPKRWWNRNMGRESWRINFFRRRSWEKSPVVHDIAWADPDYARRLPDDARRLSHVWPAAPAAAEAPVAPATVILA